MPALNAPYFHDDANARAYLESVRWPNGPVCPHCGVLGVHYRLEGKSHRAGMLKCRDCRKQFSVTVGTVFERSHIPLSKWLLAAYLLCSSKKGMSSHQLHRTLGVTYKTAWFLTHRIREAMKPGSTIKLGGAGSSGIVEADETYFGKVRGFGRGPHISKKQKVLSLVERGGSVRSFHIDRVTVNNVKPILEAQIAADARLMTDTASVYKVAAKGFGKHETVNHTAHEYVRGDVSTNTIEGYFGVLKRGLFGTYQHCGPQHLDRYLSEFDFRYNNRTALGIDDMQRTIAVLKGIGGKRLTYQTSRQ
jgi:transposase-like protein